MEIMKEEYEDEEEETEEEMEGKNQEGHEKLQFTTYQWRQRFLDARGRANP